MPPLATRSATSPNLTTLLDHTDDRSKAVTKKVDEDTRNAQDAAATFVEAKGQKPYRREELTYLNMYSLLGPAMSRHKRPDTFKQAYAGDAEPGWLNDNTIDNFLVLVAEHANRPHKNRIWRPLSSSTQQAYTAAIRELRQATQDHGRASAEANQVRVKMERQLKAAWDRLDLSSSQEFWDSVEGIILPFCHSRSGAQSGNHWTLLFIPGTRRIIRVLDSSRRLSRPEYGFAVNLLSAGLGKDFALLDWHDQAESKTQLQPDVMSCGVFTCLNALSLCRGQCPAKFMADAKPKQLKSARRYIAACLIRGEIISAGTVVDPHVLE